MVPRFQLNHPLSQDRAASGRGGLEPLTLGATPPVPRGGAGGQAGGGGGAGQLGIGAITSVHWHRSGGLWPIPRLRLPRSAGGGGGGQGVHGAGTRTRHPPSSWAALHAGIVRAVCYYARGVPAAPLPSQMRGAHAATSVGCYAAVGDPPVEEA